MGVKASRATGLRIAMLTPEYAGTGAPDGGLANYVRKTARALVERGHRPTVLTLAEGPRAWMDAGVAIHEVVRCGALVAGAALLPFLGEVDRAGSIVVELRRLTRAFWAAHATERFDLVHASSYGAPGALLVGNGQVPVVCRLSSHSPTLRAAYGRRTRLEDRLGDWLELRSAARADACFAPSRLIADAFAARADRPVSVVRTPLDPHAQDAVDDAFFQAHRPDGEYLLLFGTLSRVKGVDLLAAALPSVLARHPGLQLVLIGRDDGLPDGSKVWPMIETACGARARYFPAMDRALLRPFLAHALGVLMPSRIDNYPNACLEAQALGVPVIGSYGSSLDEMIEEGVTGFLAANGDAGSLRDAIERLLALSTGERDELKGRILARDGAARAEDRVGQLVALYEDTLTRFGARAGG